MIGLGRSDVAITLRYYVDVFSEDLEGAAGRREKIMWEIFQKPDINKLKNNNNQKGLLRLLKSKEVSIRAEAARALGEIHAVSVGSELIKLLLDHEFAVRLAAIESLISIGWHPTNAEERVLWVLARDRIDESVTLEEADISTVILVLGNNQMPLAIKRSAALVLGEKWNNEAIAALAFSLGYSDESLKQNVEQSLVKIGNAAIDKLQEIVNTDLEMEFMRQHMSNQPMTFVKPTYIFSQMANEIKERALKVIKIIQNRK